MLDTVGTLGLTVIGLAAGAWLAWRMPLVGTGLAPAADAAHVSVVIPARDEAATLPALLGSLRSCVPAPGEVLVVDDGSTDATAAVAAAHGATVLAAGEPPAGWLGKPWACRRGADEASGSVLVFLDADVTVGPDALARLAAEVAARGGLVTVQPRHRTERLYEELSAYPNAVGALAIGAFAAGRSVRPAGAFGPCLATTATDYERAGGHGAVRGRVIDDVALAHAYAGAGLPVTARVGGDVVGYRMYPDGLGRLVEGWTKNLALGATGTRPLLAFGATLWIAAHANAAAATIEGLVDGRVPVVALACWIAVAAQLAWVLRRLGTFRLTTSVLFVVPLAAFVALFLWSVVLTTVRRRVTWRGRTIPL